MSPLCPLCRSHSDHFYDIDRNAPIIFPIYSCKKCAFQFRHPLPSNEEIEAMYSQGYYEGSAAYKYQDERKSLPLYKAVWNSRLHKIKKYLKTNSDQRVFIDIGSSFGGFAQTAYEHGYQSFGIEISDFARQEAKISSPNVTTFKAISDLDLPASSVDVITMVEVIEHIADPMPMIQDLVDLLKPGGILLIQTANMASQQAQRSGKDYHYYLPGHLSYFSKSHFLLMQKEFCLSKLKIFQPVDFSLLAKLKKLSKDYPSIINIGYIKHAIVTSTYHIKSYLHLGNWAKTASMVAYLIK
ncbi:MAG: class I SAM-dependent methyltransferase [Spirochaetia bacterium]